MAVHAARGETKEAQRTAQEANAAMDGLANGIPLVGHVKAGVHLALGDQPAAEEAWRAATRTTCVVAGGVGGAVTSGPVGAVAGGMAGGALVDGTCTLCDSVVDGKYVPYGSLQILQQVFDNEGVEKSGPLFDLVALIVFDGYAGYNAGEQFIQRQRAFASPEEIAQATKTTKVGEPQLFHNPGEGYVVAWDGPTNNLMQYDVVDAILKKTNHTVEVYAGTHAGPNTIVPTQSMADVRFYNLMKARYANHPRVNVHNIGTVGAKCNALTAHKTPGVAVVRGGCYGAKFYPQGAGKLNLLGNAKARGLTLASS